MFGKVHNTAIRESLNIESLPLRIERSQLRWFDHGSRIPRKWLLKQTTRNKVHGKKPVGRPRGKWLDFIEDLNCGFDLEASAKRNAVCIGIKKSVAT